MASRFIAGIYNHCDGWCERCAHTARCLLYAQAEHDRAVSEGRPSRDPLDDLGPPTPEALEFLRELDEAWLALTPADVSELEREEERVRARVDADPMARLAKRLSNDLWGWSRRESPPARDLLLGEARALVAHYGIMLGIKVCRALHGYYEAERTGDDGPCDADARGTAKLVLEAIDALEPAIEALALVSPGDAVLLTAFAELPVLKKMVCDRFPTARSFVREGLDEAGAGAG